MEPEPTEEKSVDEVLDEIDWEKLGVEGVEVKAEPVLPAETEPVFPAQAEPLLPAETEPMLPAETEPVFPAQAEPALPAQTEVALPAKIQLFHRGSEIEIVRRWFSWETVLGTAFVLLLAWFFFRWFPDMGRISISIDSLPLLILPAVVLWLAYYDLAGWLNRTHIVVSRGTITVRHRPIPWLGNKGIDAADLKQLYTEEHVQRSSKGGTRVTYDVHAILSNDRRTKLVAGLRSSEQAYFIEHQIEQYLGIEDTR